MMTVRLPLDNGLIPRFGTGLPAACGRGRIRGGREVHAMTRVYALLAVLALIAFAAMIGGAPWGP